MSHKTKLQWAVVIPCFIALSGCTTMKALETSGDEFAKGNVISGIWNGTMGVAVGAIFDVFTLGGTTDVETGFQTINSAANPPPQRKSGTPPSAQTYTPPAAQPAPYMPPTSISTGMLTPTFTPNSNSPNNSASTPQKSGPSPQAAVRNHCVKMNSIRNKTWTEWRLINSCSEPVLVMFCYVNPDQDSLGHALRCAQEFHGLAGPIPPGGYEGVTPPGHRPGVEYSTNTFACAKVEGKTFSPTLNYGGLTGSCR